MAFTGKSTYDGGSTLPELEEDISNLIGLISPKLTPVLTALGDPRGFATRTNHEWLEDSLKDVTDALNDGTDISDSDTSIVVDDGTKFRARDIIQFAGSAELIIVTSISTNTLTCVRGYGGTTAEAVVDNTVVTIISSPSLEGEDARADISQTRSRVNNQTQIFAETVVVSGTQQAGMQVGIGSNAEVAYQIARRAEELKIQLERAVINGAAPASVTQGSSTVARTMDGIRVFITSNALTANSGVLASTGLTFTEEMLNLALRNAWESSGAMVDTLVVGGFQKRKLNSFAGALTTTRSETTAGQIITKYDSDFGTVDVVLSRHIPDDSVCMFASEKVQVMPYLNRSFHVTDLGRDGDADRKQVVGEYTLELMNQAHATWIDTLATA
jgi:hypothetical protein